jgi:anti-sigma B factor antagonist
METVERKEGPWLIVEIKGMLDVTTSSTLQEQLLRLSETEKKILLDCRELSFVSSSGLRVFLLLSKNMKKTGGVFALSEPNENVKEVFDISGLSSIFTIYPSIDAALKS